MVIAPRTNLYIFPYNCNVGVHLWVEAQRFRQSKGWWIIFTELAKLLTLKPKQQITVNKIILLEWKIDPKTVFGLLRASVQCSLITRRMSCLSSQRMTSGPSSDSALKTPRRAMRTAAASWSNDDSMCWIWDCASAQLLFGGKEKKKKRRRESMRGGGEHGCGRNDAHWCGQALSESAGV